MSNPLAIAAVTATLRNMLIDGFAGIPEFEDLSCTTLAPDQARQGTSNQLNLFLYRTSINGSLRNSVLPPAKQGETGQPALPLVLHYVLTAYGRDARPDSIFDHRLLGRAVSIFHDRPVLDRAAIARALGASDLQNQIESVKLTFSDLSAEDLSKLWTAFGGGYRVSVSYEASVVLIDSGLPRRVPLPVLTQGPADRGPVAVAGLTQAFPVLESATPGPTLPGPPPVRELVLRGDQLAGDTVSALVMATRWSAPLALGLTRRADGALVAMLPLADDDWAPGSYVAAVVVERGGERRTTAARPFELRPELVTQGPYPAQRDPNGNARVTLFCRPRVWRQQPASLLIADREVAAEPRTTTTGRLVFVVPDLAAGSYRIRLRVDHVDSQLVVMRQDAPPVFDDTQQVVVP